MSPILPTACVARPASCHPVQQRRRGRGDGIVLPVRRALEIAAGPGERPRDHPAHLPRMQHRRQIGAQLQQPLQPEGLFMRGDLEHRIRRGVADRPAGPQMLVAMLRDDRHARGMAIPKDPLRPRQPADLGHQIVGKGRHRVGEIGPVPRHRHPRQFPMPRRRVLAARHLGRRPPTAPAAPRPSPGVAAPEASRIAAPSPSRPGSASATARCRPASARPAAQACAIWPSVFDPCVAKRRRIRRAAAADGIHHDQESATLTAIRQSFSGSGRVPPAARGPMP